MRELREDSCKLMKPANVSNIYLLTYEHDDDDSGRGHAGSQGYESGGHELLDDGGGLLDHLHLHVVVPDISDIFNYGGK